MAPPRRARRPSGRVTRRGLPTAGGPTVGPDLLRERRRGSIGPATRKLQELGDTPLHVSLFVACELHAGARLATRSAEELARVERLLDLVEVVISGGGGAPRQEIGVPDRLTLSSGLGSGGNSGQEVPA